VTVCIAARCEQNEYSCIVSVSDTKLSTGYYSGEMATLKVRYLSDNWKCLIAGTFPHHVPLLERLKGQIQSEEWSQVAKACTDAFIAENTRLAEETILSTFGLTIDQFLKSRSDLGDSLYERTWADLIRIKADCQSLVYGFDSEPHIFTVENPGVDRLGFVTNCDFPGFAAIGSGSILAESKLYELHQNPARSLIETLYIALTAKFAAEAATNVGTETYVDVFAGDSHVIEFDNAFSMVEELREQREHREDFNIPCKAENIIARHLKTSKPLTSQTSEQGQ
jgi:ATP-dependent protease HslVU (ClpYQ) peptidase subunit